MKHEHDLGLDVDPLAPACLDAGRVINRRQFQQWLQQLKQSLRVVGVLRGDLVAVCLSSGAKALALHHSLVAMSAVTMVLPVRWTAESQLAWLLLKQPRCVVVDSVQLAQMLRSKGLVVLLLEDLLKDVTQMIPTGKPRIRLQQANVGTCRLELRANQAAQGLTARVSHKQWQQWMDEMHAQASPQTRWLLGPLHMSVTVASALGVLRAGGVVVFEPYRTATAWMGLVQSKAITHAYLDSFWLSGLLAAVDVPGVALPSMQMLRLMGQVVSPEMLTRVRERLTPHVVEASSKSAVLFTPPEKAEHVKEKHRSTGDELQGIAIRRGVKGVTGDINPLPPEDWLNGVNGKRWLH